SSTIGSPTAPPVDGSSPIGKRSPQRSGSSLRAGLTGAVPSLDSGIPMHDSMCWGWHRLPTEVIEPDGYLQETGAETGCMTRYIDSASPTNPTLTTGMMD